MEQSHTCTMSKAGSVVTLTPKTGMSHPDHMRATTIVVNTVSNPASPDFWGSAAEAPEYDVIIRRRTKN
jgi:hypothetical protein